MTHFNFYVVHGPCSIEKATYSCPWVKNGCGKYIPTLWNVCPCVYWWSWIEYASLRGNWVLTGYWRKTFSPRFFNVISSLYISLSLKLYRKRSLHSLMFYFYVIDPSRLRSSSRSTAVILSRLLICLSFAAPLFC